MNVCEWPKSKRDGNLNVLYSRWIEGLVVNNNLYTQIIWRLGDDWSVGMSRFHVLLLMFSWCCFTLYTRVWQSSALSNVTVFSIVKVVLLFIRQLFFLSHNSLQNAALEEQDSFVLRDNEDSGPVCREESALSNIETIHVLWFHTSHLISFEM